MRPDAGIVLTIALIAALGGPLALGLAGLVGRRGEAAPGPRVAWDWRLTVASALCCTLAFNLVYFVQELFLVLPKAFVPGLAPVLFHNNHDWTGEHPLARLFQGTGALAVLLLGLAALAWLKARPPQPVTIRLLVIWIAYLGLFMALPQVVTGAALPDNDVGMAMDYLHLPAVAMMTCAAAAVVAMAVAGRALARQFLALARDSAQIDSRARRTGFVFRAAVLPGLAATLLLAPFRVPGDLDQVVIFPVLVLVLGLVWIQAWAWRLSDVRPAGAAGRASIAGLAIALALVLAIFQLILRPGVPF